MCGKFKNSIKDKKRFGGAVVSLILGSLIIVYLLRYNGIYTDPPKDFSNYPRLFWCLAFSFLGFSIPAYRASKSTHDDNAIITYSTTYLISLIIISCLVFAILHTSERTSNYLFYFSSSSICFTFSYFIDNVLNEGLISILKKIR